MMGLFSFEVRQSKRLSWARPLWYRESGKSGVMLRRILNFKIIEFNAVTNKKEDIGYTDLFKNVALSAFSS